ncbi:MAG TPA: type IX secretion system sortase PorU [Saprospiraceae bacterium]|nr:type IX secretion system sortase PorU [Saprospiraceae bacterium]
MIRIYLFVFLIGLIRFNILEAQPSGPGFKETSILSTGIIHRVSVSQTGVYKLDYTFIKDKLKIEPGTLNPGKIAIYGNGNGRVPQWNGADRIDDLEETATFAVGLEDGKFDQGDYLLWYAEGADRWRYDPAARIYHMDKNIYDELNHYYIIINSVTRTSMGSRADGSAGQYESNASLTFQRLEEEKVNLLGRYRPPGSGQEWYGDELAVINEIDYSNEFDLTDIIPADTFYYKVRFAARAASASRFYFYFNQHEFSRSLGSVTLGDFEASFANDAIMQGSFKPTDAINKILIKYPTANGIDSRAWIDYIEINTWKQNKYASGKPLFIRDPRSNFLGTPKYIVSGIPANGMIWDVSDPLKPMVQQFETNGSQGSFSVSQTSGLPSQFIVFDPSKDVLNPDYERVVKNQNLHSLQIADLIIVYYDEFADAAEKLAEHRSTHDQLEVVTVPVSQVFEEFSGGSIDPSAIRDFARMMYKRDVAFRYLLLFGDATYDYQGRFAELPRHNFVPAFETEESLDPIRSFPTDDYFGLLDDNEAEEETTLKGAVDIAIGRIPSDTPEEAMAVVDKIIHYDTSPSTLNDWRQRVVMVADDEDSNTHLAQADGLANQNSVAHPELNMNKIYLDAFPQEATPGGDRYPGVNEAIDLNMRKGALTVTYLGHGGQNGWSQERVLGINQAQSYNNLDNMPLFITATCSFAGYDEPSFKTAGEYLLSNPNGGAIALMTTVRAVYSGSNERLTKAVLEQLYNPDAPGEYTGMGEVLRRSKNTSIDSVDINARKFTLLGDPSGKLVIPQYHIAVTEIDGNPVGGSQDTLSALEKANVSGVVLDDQGNVLNNFNGELSLTVFDKVQIRKTLANDEKSMVRSFTTQNRQLFKGKATITDGHWTIEFVLPKDIDFSYGPGKFSFYAQDGTTDASGYFSSFIIGGVSSEGLSDDQPPVIDLFMNDAHFVSGGITDSNPYIYAELMDDFGINVSGTGVGHDIEAILDGDNKNSLILNDFYVAALDDYKKGIVRYPMSNLKSGKHTLKITAWDLANNPGEAYIEFVVVDEPGPILLNVLNYPNPLYDFTRFQFEHNRPGVPMDIRLNIYTLTGQLIKTIEREDFIADGYRVDDLTWDGLSDNNGQVAKGLYVYKIKVTFNVNGTTENAESKAGKLVILR